MISLSELLKLLNNNYLNRYQTLLVGGFEEPFYQASIDNKPAKIQFAHDYIRSALHELSHWCVAGIERRQLDDYGYWYAQDGRSQEQQDEFFKLEVKPQTIEWAFSTMCGINFEASVDNLNNSVVGVTEFEHSLVQQMHKYLDKGFTKRVDEIINLIAHYQNIPLPYQYLLNNRQ